MILLRIAGLLVALTLLLSVFLPLVAARRPGTTDARKAAFKALETQLSAGTFVLPIAFADEVVVARSNLQQVVVQPVGDPSDRCWDVLTWRLANDR